MESLVISNTSEFKIKSEEEEEEQKDKCDNISSSVLFKKIEFHPARKQINGFASNHCNSDFLIETLNPDSGRKSLNNLNPSHSSSLPGSDFVENGLDLELTFGTTFRKIGAGLQNLGNTCFLNSVLQCLTYTEPLAAYLQSGKHQTSCHIAGFCALCAIQKHVSRALQSTGRSLVPKDLVSNLRCISRNFRNARQEDAHEYMVNLLESMHKCCLPSGVPSESPAAYEKSLVHKIFGGRLRSQVECQQCSYCSNKFDPFLDLSLDIVKADTLPAALRNFTAAELLDGGDKHYQCQKCKQKVRAKKRLTVHNAPNVLSIHLKRFHAHDPGRKVDKKVLFNHSLDMKPFVSGSYEGHLKYSLYGVLVHFGHSTHSGHYVCFVRTSSGIWHLLNDNEVRPVSKKIVLGQKAYMLFYVRDRKNIAPKRPAADVSPKENMKASNLTNLVFKQISKEHVDNGLIGTRSHAANSTSSVNQKDALNFNTSKEISQKQALDRPLISVCSLRKTNPIAEPSSSSQLPRNPPKEVSPNPELGECLSPSAPSMNSKCDPGTAKVDKAAISTGAKMSDCNKASSNCNETQNSPIEKLVENESSEKVNLVLNVGVDGAVEKVTGDSQSDSSDKVSNKIETIKVPNKLTCGSSQGGDFPDQNTSGNSLGDHGGNSGQHIVNELAEPSIPSVARNEGLHKKAPDCTPHKKSKKVLKYRISNMPIGLKFFRASLHLRKKKNHKKSKLGTLGTQNLIKEQLLDRNCSLSEVGPSTSKMAMAVSIISTNSQSQRKRAKSRLKRGGDTLKDIVDQEFEKRNNQNSDSVPMDKHLTNSISTSEVNGHDAIVLDCRETTRENMPGNGMCILAQVLEDTTVARWDGQEFPQSQIVESSIKENIRIGYVPDEWDEEYDRGKRKKVRQNKHDFGGPNPFQEFASEKTQFKKARMDRSSSGNKPFRI